MQGKTFFYPRQALLLHGGPAGKAAAQGFFRIDPVDIDGVYAEVEGAQPGVRAFRLAHYDALRRHDEANARRLPVAEDLLQAVQSFDNDIQFLKDLVSGLGNGRGAADQPSESARDAAHHGQYFVRENAELFGIAQE